MPESFALRTNYILVRLVHLNPFFFSQYHNMLNIGTDRFVQTEQPPVEPS